MPFPLLPTWKTEVITDIKPDFLKAQGIRLVMLDFDNTIVPYTTNTPTDEGLMMGDTLDQMISIYGENYTQNGTEYAYYRGDTILIILAKDNIINSIEIRMAG